MVTLRYCLNIGLLAGTLPSSFAKLRYLRWLDLSMNNLQGNIPVLYANMSLLYEMDLSDNQGLQGCVPLSPSTIVYTSGTQITGLCAGGSAQIEQQEQAAMWQVREFVFCI